MGWRDDLLAVARVGAGFVGETLVKASRSDDGTVQDEDQDRAPGGDARDTAANAPVPTEGPDQDPKALVWDPFAVVEQLGYKERYSNISYGTLKAIVYKTPVIAAIVQTRVNQVAAFAQPQSDRYQLGYQLKLRDSERSPTKADKNWTKQMTVLIQRTGVTDEPRGRDNFETFLRRLVHDSLIYDQLCFEVVPNRMGQPAQWDAVDASTMRLADSRKLRRYTDEDSDDVKYVQVYDGSVINEFTQEELCFGVRNPRTDIRLNGYGVGELELLIQTVTSMLYSWQYNEHMFTKGSAQKGILNFKGVVPDKQMKAFRRHWYQMISGIENAWRTPVVNSQEGLEWVAMQNSNRDMEFSAWFDFLIKVACSMYSMDPVEVNFKYGNTNQGSALGEASNKEKITESKERGLRPLLSFLESCINQYIIWPINEDFVFKFVGLDAQTREDVAKLNTQRVKSTWMVDELRAEEDLPPLPDGMGQVILDPTFLQVMQMKQGGAPGEEGPGGDGEVDFESLLAGGGDEEGDDEGEGDEGGGGDRDTGEAKGGGGAAAAPAESDGVQKSLAGRPRVVVDIDL